MAYVKQYTASIDMADSTVSELSNVFPYNVEKSLAEATSITLQNINLSEVYYTSVPAWYNKTNKRLYSVVTSTSYWVVSGNKLTYTTPE